MRNTGLGLLTIHLVVQWPCLIEGIHPEYHCGNLGSPHPPVLLANIMTYTYLFSWFLILPCGLFVVHQLIHQSIDEFKSMNWLTNELLVTPNELDLRKISDFSVPSRGDLRNAWAVHLVSWYTKMRGKSLGVDFALIACSDVRRARSW